MKLRIALAALCTMAVVACGGPMTEEELQAEQADPVATGESDQAVNTTPGGGGCTYSYECGSRAWCCNDGIGGGVCRPNTEPCGGYPWD